MSPRTYFLLTRGKVLSGTNAGHRIPDLMDIQKIKFPEEINCFVIGTNQSSREIHNVLQKVFSQKNIPVKYSAFCGITDELNENGDVVIFDGSVIAKEDYLGLDVDFFNPDNFLTSYPNKTLFCVDKSFLRHFDMKEQIAQDGQLYEVDHKSRTIKIFT